AVLAHRLLLGERGEVFVGVHAEGGGGLGVLGGGVGVGVPGEDVADRGLAGLVPPQAGHDAGADHVKPGWHLGEMVAGYDVAGGDALDGDHLAGPGGVGGGRGDVRVDVADGDGDAFGQDGSGGGLGGEGAGQAAEGGEGDAAD